MTYAPKITKLKLCSMQICVPAHWTDEQAQTWANETNNAGTTRGWQIRPEGSELLAGDPYRVPCAERKGFVHIMLDC